ncbi:MAG TPA: hypothetical protein VLZ83_00880 [Edaphocola sp.]|nr:hypothetical protein [Edaphocola sp.]
MFKFKKYLSQFFYKFGILIKINTIKSENFFEIKETLLNFKENNDLSSYSKFINKISNQNIKHLKFIGVGGSISSTQTHTLVQYKGQYYFEKIFDANAIEFQFLQENYSDYHEILKQKEVIIPKLVHIFERNGIAICHFEYFEILQPLQSDWMDEAITLLYKFQSLPYKGLKFSKHYSELTLTRDMSKLLLELSINENTLKEFVTIKNFVEKSKYTFTHGDFYKSNVFRNVVLDWDEMGFYPFGLDWVVALHNDDFNNANHSSIYSLFEELSIYDLDLNQKINIAYFYLILLAYQSSFDALSRADWVHDLSAHLSMLEKQP